ncbi:hypothetical protein EUTSA_v10025915mg [Eutrema salsugineum]|uniref:DUF4408 domain-containing protein n=1 Tax=Eutrema salsugineum TaxID=72664 RepID=V4P5B2_EUTSA|nr:uncharacterized protein LOC18029415 [Eutrema salsugineum]ESQ54676.1 hypothetical protein EUTSA_v10025915mg [Eutrema salsugineum]
MELVTNLASWFTPTTLFLLLNLTIGTLFFTNRFGSGSKKYHPHQDGFGSGHTHAPAPLARAPSLIDRVRSINFNLYNSPTPESEIHFSGSDSNPNPPPSLLERVKSINMPYFKFPQHNSEEDYAAYALMTRPDETNRVDKISEDDVPTQPRFGAPSLLQRVKSIKLPSLYRSEPDLNSEQTPARTKSESSKPAMKNKKKKAAKKKLTKSASERSGMGYNGKEEETVEAVEKRRPETTRVERTTSIGEGEEGVDDKASDFINKFKQQLKLQRLDSFLRYRDMLKNE